MGACSTVVATAAVAPPRGRPCRHVGIRRPAARSHGPAPPRARAARRIGRNGTAPQLHDRYPAKKNPPERGSRFGYGEARPTAGRFDKVSRRGARCRTRSILFQALHSPHACVPSDEFNRTGSARRAVGFCRQLRHMGTLPAVREPGVTSPLAGNSVLPDAPATPR
jgi:hypothetical protein